MSDGYEESQDGPDGSEEETDAPVKMRREDSKADAEAILVIFTAAVVWLLLKLIVSKSIRMPIG